MRNITVIIRFGGEKKSFPTRDDVILDDFLQQLGGQGVTPAGQNWLVTKMGSEEALDLGRSFADNHVEDGDVLDLGNIEKGG